ncbi:Cupin domain-containing protein [Natronorubrum sediminis]|uniref:Cupin domain-containing protein n=1 Tax=Natronorubrum sediminis TaxID=640943 RepID=A0A1H6FQA6_9EURY|nr:cupin domain-containing protein [Natronorubrum sediminis]SEH11935.1 Cupin domain-containing protein [Natronorubrum sediminis]
MATTSKNHSEAPRAVDLDQFEGADVYQESDEHARVRGYFPLTPGMPNGTDAGAEESMIVCIEIEPGNYLPSHEDSNEELLVVTAGAVEATVGDDTIDLRAGQCAVVPEMVPHAISNTGEETAYVIGFFPNTELTATFDETLEPFGSAELAIGPVPPEDRGNGDEA